MIEPRVQRLNNSIYESFTSQADIVVLANNEHPLITEELTGLTVEDKKLSNDQSALMVITSQVLNRKDVSSAASRLAKFRILPSYIF